MKLQRISFGFLLAILMVGCSVTPPAQVDSLPKTTADITGWHTEGRVGIRTKDDALSGNFTWDHSPEYYELNIFGPFGQGATRLFGIPNKEANLSYDDKELKGNNPEVLLYRELGWNFPVTNVQYWIRGLAAPNSKAEIAYREDGVSPTQIIQDGWTIAYKEYSSVGHLQLPQRLQVTRSPYRVNLIITDWIVK